MVLKRFLVVFVFFLGGVLYAQTDHHFFFLNEELVNSDPANYTPGSKYLSEVDYNENGNSGYPSASSNFYTSNVAMSPFCTSARKSVYNFRQKTGLKYTRHSGDDFSNYTITIIIKFNQVVNNTYYRIIDFSNGQSDNGIYAYGSNLNFYPTGNIASNVFSSSQFTFLTLTRNAATNVIDVYVNDNLVTTYNDSSNYYEFSSSLIFARDNLPGTPAPNEDTNGQIAYIHVTDNRSTAADVKDTYDNICSLIPPDIQANNDEAPDAHGDTGEVVLLNVLDNDTKDATPVTLNDVSMTIVTPDATGSITLNNDGTVDLAANTPVGDYTIVYELCDKQFPNICDQGTVTVSVLPTPEVLNVTEDIVCFNGSGTLTATPSTGSINWYDAPSGGNFLGTGTTFITPIITATTTFYAEAFEGSWRVSDARAPVVATVQNTASPTAIPNQFFCDTDNATIADISVTGTDIKWYANAIGEVPLNTTNSLVNATYYATQTLLGCESDVRTPVNVTVSETVAPLAQTDIPDLEGCDDDNDGVFTFNLMQHEALLLNGRLASDFTFAYFEDSSRTISIVSPGTYSNSVSNQQEIFVRISNNANTNCYTDVSFNIVILPTPVLFATGVTLEQCDDDTDGETLFNLTEANILITNETGLEITYYQTLAEAQTGLLTDRITNFLDYPNNPNLSSPDNEIFARLENSFGCYKAARIQLVVGVSQIPSSFQALQYVVCDDEQVDGDKRNGIATFDFSDAKAQIEALFSGGDITVSFYNNEVDALTEINPISDISNHRNEDYPNQQDIYVRVDSNVLNACLGLGNHVTLTVEALPIAHPVVFAVQCEDDPTDDSISYPFDTSNLESDLLQGQTNVLVEYFDTSGNPLQDFNGNPISSPFPSIFRTETQTITARVTNTATNTNNNISCYDETQITFSVDQQPLAFPVIIPPLCDNGVDTTDGLGEFDTSTIQSAILGGQSGMDVVYTSADGSVLPTPLPNPFVSYTQTITATVSNPLNLNCYASVELDFVVNPLPQFEVDEDRVACTNLVQSIVLETYNAQSNDYSYRWTNSAGEEIGVQAQIVVAVPDDYTVIATSNLGCSSLPRVVHVSESTLPTTSLDDIDIVENTNNNSITINNVESKGYDFALDDEFGSYQDEPYFNNVLAGVHTVYVRSKEGCGIAEIELFILGFPKFFTPNDDGYNDTWQILGLSYDYTNASKVSIYDRYGKLLKQINAKENSWNGLFRGAKLPASDYWYVAELVKTNGDVKIYKGHFSLVR